MKRLPLKKYQRLCGQYNRAMQRAIRLEIRLNQLVNTHLTSEEASIRDCDFSDATMMRSFLIPLEAELNYWREEKSR